MDLVLLGLVLKLTPKFMFETQLEEHGFVMHHQLELRPLDIYDLHNIHVLSENSRSRIPYPLHKDVQNLGGHNVDTVYYFLTAVIFDASAQRSKFRFHF